MNSYANKEIQSGIPYVSVLSWKNIVELFPGVSEVDQPTPYYLSSDHNPIMVEVLFSNLGKPVMEYLDCN